MKNSFYLPFLIFIIFSKIISAQQLIPSNSILLEKDRLANSSNLLRSPEGKLFHIRNFHNQTVDTLRLELYRLDEQGRVKWKKRFEMRDTQFVAGDVYFSVATNAEFIDTNSIVVHFFSSALDLPIRSRMFSLMLDTAGNIKTSKFYANIFGYGNDVMLIKNGSNGYFITTINNLGINVEPTIFQCNKQAELTKVVNLSNQISSIFPLYTGSIISYGERFGNHIYLMAEFGVDNNFTNGAILHKLDTNLVSSQAVYFARPRDSTLGTNSNGFRVLNKNKIWLFSNRKYDYIFELDSNFQSTQSWRFYKTNRPNQPGYFGIGSLAESYLQTFPTLGSGLRFFSATGLSSISENFEIFDQQRFNKGFNTFSANLPYRNTLGTSASHPYFGFTISPSFPVSFSTHALRFFHQDSLAGCNIPAEAGFEKESFPSPMEATSSFAVNAPIPVGTNVNWVVRDMPYCQIMGCEVPDMRISGITSTCADSVTLSIDSLPGQTVIWSTGDTLHTIRVAVPGQYTVVSQGNCPTFIDSITVIKSPLPFIGNIDPENEICFGDSITMEVRNIVGVNYRWMDRNTRDTLSRSNTLTIRHQNINQSGNQIVVLHYSQGLCEDSIQFQVNKKLPQPLALPDSISTCKADTLFRISELAIAPQWISPENDTTANASILFNTSGTYRSEYFINGCKYEDSIHVSLNQTISGIIISTINGIATDSATVSLPATIQFTIPENARDILWKCFADNAFSPGGLTESFVVVNSGVYSCQVDYQVPNGCRALATKAVQLNALDIPTRPQIKIPNVVLLNSQTINKKFHILNIEEYPENSLEIFNRWGKKVFESETYLNQWPSNADISPGLYFYFLIVEGQKYNGWIQVL